MGSVIGVGLILDDLFKRKIGYKKEIADIENKFDGIYFKIIDINKENIKRFIKENELDMGIGTVLKIKFRSEMNKRGFDNEYKKGSYKIIEGFDIKNIDELINLCIKRKLLLEKLNIVRNAFEKKIEESYKRIGWLGDIIKSVKNVETIEDIVLSKSDIDEIVEKIWEIEEWSYYDDGNNEKIDENEKKRVVEELVRIKSYLDDDEIICIVDVYWLDKVEKKCYNYKKKEMTWEWLWNI